jgi:poly(hydroxyalkanoate) depolymerase family esterase
VKPDQILDTIERALRAAGLEREGAAAPKLTRTLRDALKQKPAPAGAQPFFRGEQRPGMPAWRAPAGRAGAPTDRAPRQGRTVDLPGTSTEHVISNGRAQRRYQLYRPASAADRPVPLIVMLHGCTQNPEDFARGTRMNELAERHGFLVAYPAQAVQDNGRNCWNWFVPEEQGRDGTEASLIAAMARTIVEAHDGDPSRVFIAGLSAGAAMAVIAATSYPEVFSAVAAHSGVPVGSAHDVPSAFAAMQGRGAAPAPHRPAVRTFVMHGDADTTVAPSNGAAIAEQAARAARSASGSELICASEHRVIGTRECLIESYLDDAGTTQVERWVVRGGAHAWFGGSAAGSYTEADGPDASAEMVRFFLAA